LKGLTNIFSVTKIVSTTPELNPNVKVTGNETDQQLIDLLTAKKDVTTKTKPKTKTQNNGLSAEGETDV
jgi:hypothetical protein